MGSSETLPLVSTIGAADVAGEQVVQRRVRQQHADVAVAGRDGRRQRSVGAAAQQDDRSATRRQRLLLDRVDLGQGVGGGEVGNQDGERLVLPVLARAQRADRGLVGGEGGEVVAAEALDGDDGAGPQRGGRGGDRVGRRVPAPRPPQPRPARRAAHRLRVEPPVRGVGVLPRAVGAHRERRHRRRRTVVGHPGDDREPRPAVRAVGERVAVAAVGRVAELTQAVRAGRGVRRDERGARAVRGARGDREGGVADGGERADVDARHHGQRGRALTQRGDEPRQRGGRSLGLDQHPRLVVADEPGQPELRRQRVHERPEPDALHDPGDPDARPGGCGHASACCTSSHSTW